jgi:hypothetical protein
MDETWLREAAHWTARMSAAAFVVALAAPAFSRAAARHRALLFALFAALHTVHFALVAFFATAHPDASIFPGGRSAEDVGGWPAIAGIALLFHTLVALAAYGPFARRAALRAGGRFAVAFLAFMFVATYLPLTVRSPWYALGAALVAIAACVDLFGDRLRRFNSERGVRACRGTRRTRR